MPLSLYILYTILVLFILIIYGFMLDDMYTAYVCSLYCSTAHWVKPVKGK